MNAIGITGESLVTKRVASLWANGLARRP